ncbi:MAG: hypothetical protein NC314_13510 [Roseburia sp.]|nr:hypothetical protein [Ruminococcus sp.]MCM1156583.1 hypothetical protein [Roseburia sp.]MCM1243855.1 hypothetical protein [Roseburia sp.]
MRKKKNRFLLFCCSFCPGAGELYLGFMKMGLSLLLIFALSVMFVSYSGIGVLTFVPMVIWVYGFFHANNLGGLSDEAFMQVKDEYLFGIGAEDTESVKDFFTGKYRKVFAVILILLGVSMAWQTVCRTIRYVVGNDFYFQYISPITGYISNEVPRAIVGIAVIWIGVKMIQGKKRELDQLEDMESKTEQETEGERHE